MNVFVLCTGRCGSTTFVEACSHFTNYTAGHETLSTQTGPARLAYPDRHIEADNRLSWMLGRLDEAYGDNARYVHLTRDPAMVARSFSVRTEWDGAIMTAYHRGILMRSDVDVERAAADMVETVSANIRHFLRDKTFTFDFRLEEWRQDFPDFCEWIGAEGDMSRAIAEFETPHNART